MNMMIHRCLTPPPKAIKEPQDRDHDDLKERTEGTLGI